MGIGETSAKIIGTCMISVGMNIPNHNPAINNVNCKALGGRVHLLGYILASNRCCFGDEHRRECRDSGGVRVPGLQESAFECEWQSTRANLQIEETVPTERSPMCSGGNRAIMNDVITKWCARNRVCKNIYRGLCFQQRSIVYISRRNLFCIKNKNIGDIALKARPWSRKAIHMCHGCCVHSQPKTDTRITNSQNVITYSTTT